LLIQDCVAAMVRIEHMDFLLPMKIGEVAELTAEIVYTSTHSLLVGIKVHAENIITGSVADDHIHVAVCSTDGVIMVGQKLWL